MRNTTNGGIKKHQLIQNDRSRFLIPARIPASVKLVRASEPQATIPCTKSMTGLTSKLHKPLSAAVAAFTPLAATVFGSG
jgi:hypothetical protein